MMPTSVSPNQFQIEGTTYGAATAEVRSVVDAAKQLRWFPQSRVDDEQTVRDLLVKHFEVLGEQRSNGRRLDTEAVHFVRGGWRLLGQSYRAANPVAADDDPAYTRGEWRRLLGSAAARLQERLETSHASVVVPPLFPFAGKATILAGMLTTDPARGASIIDDHEWRETIWYLMCDVDSDFWNAIVAALASDAGPVANPFALLIEIYTRGFYPLGFIDNRFVVYTKA